MTCLTYVISPFSKTGAKAKQSFTVPTAWYYFFKQPYWVPYAQEFIKAAEPKSRPTLCLHGERCRRYDATIEKLVNIHFFLRYNNFDVIF